jgi:hypothetical protein
MDGEAGPKSLPLRRQGASTAGASQESKSPQAKPLSARQGEGY